MAPAVQAFFDAATFTVTYLVSDPDSGAALVVDPVFDFDLKSGRLATRSADALLDAVARGGLTLLYTLETHAHADHLSAGDYIRQKTGAKLGIGRRIREVQRTFIPVFEISDMAADGADFDLLFDDGDTLDLGSLTVEVLATPGHTAADVSYKIGDVVLIGDTLFMPDYGTARTDFPGGNAVELYRSIRKILALPDETRLLVGHDYLPATRDTYAWESTVSEQKASNVMANDSVDEAAFVAARQARDAELATPNLLLPALQVNIRGGRLPAPGPSGRVFLKIPVTQL